MFLLLSSVMRIFLWGQIKERCRGSSAAVVYINYLDQTYHTHVDQMNSERFIDITGIRALSYPLARIYIGISEESGEQLLNNSQGKKTSEVKLEELDQIVASQYFIGNEFNLAIPKRIILEWDESGYRVNNH